MNGDPNGKNNGERHGLWEYTGVKDLLQTPRDLV